MILTLENMRRREPPHLSNVEMLDNRRGSVALSVEMLDNRLAFVVLNVEMLGNLSCEPCSRP